MNSDIIITWFSFNLVKRETHIINMYLATLSKHINLIDGGDLEESKVELYVLMINVALIWINCPNFQKFDYIVTLIKVICNMIMDVVFELQNNYFYLFKHKYNFIYSITRKLIFFLVFEVFRTEYTISR